MANFYHQKFRESNLNNILLLPQLNEIIMQNKIEIKNNNHRNTIINETEKYLKETTKFTEWLMMINMVNYHSIFANNGIVCFDAFNHFFQGVDDIIAVIGDVEPNKADAQFMWNYRDLKF